MVVPLLVSVRAQQRSLTLDDIYSPTSRINFSGAVPSGLTWIDGSRLAWPRNIGDGVTWTSVDVDGAERDVFEPATMQSALEQLGVPSADARRASHARTLVFNARSSAAVAEIADDLYAYHFGSKRAVRLTTAAGEEEHVSFSPDGRLVAFVRGDNLFVVDANGGAERALTSDGAPSVLNGKLDWVYEEEIYGRGVTRAYWWSPDSSSHRLSAHRRSSGAELPRRRSHSLRAERREWDYPKAGDSESGRDARVVAAAGGAARTGEHRRLPRGDLLIVRGRLGRRTAAASCI